MLPLTKGSSLAVQFSRFGDLPAVIDIARKVPIADSHDFEDLTFVATSLKAKAAVQIAGSIFLTSGLQCSVELNRSAMVGAQSATTAIFLRHDLHLSEMKRNL